METIITFMTDSIFSKIIRREIPAQFVYEDDTCVVIMDKFPSIKGQTLVIPKQEVDYAYDLDDHTYAHIFKIAKKIALASDKALDSKRTCLVVEGFEVPHVHIKLYPMQEGDKNLSAALSAGPETGDEELNELATAIRESL